jgi:hypothetical protein
MTFIYLFIYNIMSHLQMHQHMHVWNLEFGMNQALTKKRNKIGTMKAGTMTIIKRMKFAKNITRPHTLSLISWSQTRTHRYWRKRSHVQECRILLGCIPLPNHLSNTSSGSILSYKWRGTLVKTTHGSQTIKFELWSQLLVAYLISQVACSPIVTPIFT